VYRDWGSEFSVSGLGGRGFRVYGLEFRVRDDMEAVGFREGFSCIFACCIEIQRGRESARARERERARERASERASERERERCIYTYI
jgi:hypothetical protein